MLFRNNDEFDSTILIIFAMVAWLLHTAAVVLADGFGESKAAEISGRFIESIVLMVFTYKFTKSRPTTKGD